METSWKLCVFLVSFLAPAIKHHHPMIFLWTVAFPGEASASGRNWLPNGCRMVAEAAEAAKCLQFPMADSLGTWHLALGSDQEFSKTAFFAVLPTEEIRSVE